MRIFTFFLSALLFLSSSMMGDQTDLTIDVDEQIDDIQYRSIVQIETSKGDIIIRLFNQRAPLTCANFLSYVEEGFYINTLIHRVIDGFIVQGGGYTSDFVLKSTKEPIQNESRQGVSNLTGTVSMALNQNKNSAAAQFFFNLADNLDLDYSTKKGKGYTVFAEVIEGMDVLKKIRLVRTRKVNIYSEKFKRNISLYDVPEEFIVIRNVKKLR